jgi:hypothetical protein
LDEDNSLLLLSVNYLNHTPAPYTPNDVRVFVVHQDQANQIAGYTQWPDKLIKNANGSYWISSYAPPTYDISSLIASKIADSIPGTGYVGQNKQVFVLNPLKNSITNVTTKKSHRWWHYELRPGL